jgi:glucose-fructose oxidoreductase
MRNLHNPSRRRFIRTSAGIAASIPFTSLASSVLASKKKDRLGVALVGLGYYSRDLLAPALQLTQNCYLAGIVTGSPEKIPVWQKQYSIPDRNIYNYENMHRVADNPDIDIIYIVLPNSLHKKYSILAAEAGKQVWCEKPMAMNVAECEAIINTCNKNKVKLSIGYRMQHEPNTQTVMQIARNKPYGKINKIFAEAGFYDGRASYHWRLNKSMGGGAMYDMGVYPLNAARYASAAEPIAVTAISESHRSELYKEVDETMHFMLEFADGLIAECSTSFGKSMNRLRAECEKGWYQLQPFQSYTGVKGSTSDGRNLNKSIQNQQARQMDNDALAILHHTSVLVPGEEGLRDVRIVEAIYKSAADKKRVLIG